MSDTVARSFWQKTNPDDLESSLVRFFNHLPGMAYRCAVEEGHQYRLLFASRGCKKLLGLPVEEALRDGTNTVEKLMLEEDLGAVRRAIREAVLEKRPYDMYYRIRSASDKIKWIWDRGEGVFDKEGNCIFLEGIMMDVSEQKTNGQRLKCENLRMRAPVAATSPGSLVGTSPAIRRVFPLMVKAAQSDVAVILYGETGVGKDMSAQTLHEMSGVRGRYIAVNCAAIPEQLLESEFFGHAKGAFSGAPSNRQGYLAAADKGTLFLDEVAELPINLQAKLLRVLDGKAYTPVGSNESRISNFRLISATNRDLGALVRNKGMRADFFFRIHILPIVLPPLRERKEDIPLLVADYARKKGIELTIPDCMLHTLMEYSWPGNVRELYNVLEKYQIVGEMNCTTALPADIFESPFPQEKKWQEHCAAPASPAYLADIQERQIQDAATDISLADAKEDSEKSRILTVLERNNWKKGRTAAALQVSMRTLQRKLKRYGISGKSKN